MISGRIQPPDWPGVMQWDWTIWMDGIPRPWTRPRTRGGNAYAGMITLWTPFHNELYLRAKQQRPVVPLSGSLRLEVAFHFPRPKAKVGAYWKTSTPDLDNLVKGVGDILQHAEILDDDRFVVAISASKIYSETPGVAIYLRAEPPPAQHYNNSGTKNNRARKTQRDK